MAAYIATSAWLSRCAEFSDVQGWKNPRAFAVVMPRLAFDYFIALWLYTDSFTTSSINYSQMYGTSFYGTSLLGLRAEDIKWAVFEQECTYIFFEENFKLYSK